MSKLLALLLVFGLALAALPSKTGAQDPTELTFWTFVDAHAAFMEAQAERWNEANPDRPISIVATVTPYEEMHDALLLSLVSGTGAPDLADIEIAKFPNFLQGDIQLVDLTDAVDPYRDSILATRLAPYQVDGHQYGIDYHVGTFVMYYNTEVMAAAGVDIDSIVTWDDYIEAGKLVTGDTDNDGETDRWMTTIETTDRFSAIGLMLQNGGGVYNADGEFVLNSPENAEALQLVGDMVNEHGIAIAAPGGLHHATDYYDQMNTGHFGSVWMPQWYMIRFTDFMPDLAGKIVVRPMPVFEEGGFTSTMGGGTGTAITAQTPEGEVQLAKDFLGFAKLSYDSNVLIWTELGFDPLNTDVYEDPALTEPMPYFSDEAVFTTIKAIQENLAVEYLGPLYADAVELLRTTTIFDVVVNGVSAEEALESTASQLE
jgi:arabinosaccharide transport system substrate-binding protein